jgi:hypothetical protein
MVGCKDTFLVESGQIFFPFYPEADIEKGHGFFHQIHSRKTGIIVQKDIQLV